MRTLAMIALVALTGCEAFSATNEAAAAEEEFRLVEKHARPQEVCDAARRARDAYLRRRDEAKFRHWQNTMEVRCFIAATPDLR